MTVYAAVLGALDHPHDAARLHDADARGRRNDQPRASCWRACATIPPARTDSSSTSAARCSASGRRTSPTRPGSGRSSGLRPGSSGSAVWRVRRSRLGAILRATRAERGADAVLRLRHLSLRASPPSCFVNVIAGVCGLLHVLNSGFVSPESLGLGVSTNALVAALIGGVAEFDRPARRRRDLRLRAGPIRRARRSRNC